MQLALIVQHKQLPFSKSLNHEIYTNFTSIIFDAYFTYYIEVKSTPKEGSTTNLQLKILPAVLLPHPHHTSSLFWCWVPVEWFPSTSS